MGVIAPKYMERFGCVGSACEDTCCRGWRVTIDQKSHDALAAAMAESEDNRAEFDRKVKRLPLAEATDMAYATAERDDDGQCLFVRDDGLCSIHARFGPELLSNTCAMFPRELRITKSSVEFAAQVSCPELARELLLREDSMDLVAMPSDAIERHVAHDQVAANDFYAHYLDDIRDAMMQLAQLRDFSMAERLFVMTFFAQKTAPFFFHGVDSDPGPGLEEVIGQMSRPGVLPAIADELHKVDVPLAVTSTLAGEIGLVGKPVSPSFAKLVERVFATLDSCRIEPDSAADADADADDETEDAAGFDAERLAALHGERSRRLHALAGHRVDGYTERFVLNYWFRRWYTGSEDLLHHMRDLLIEVAVQQLLLCSHPDVLAAVEATEKATEKDSANGDQRDALHDVLDRAAVETIARTSRCIEHTNLRAIVGQRLLEQGMPAFAYTVCLLKFAAGFAEPAASTPAIAEQPAL